MWPFPCSLGLFDKCFKVYSHKKQSLRFLNDSLSENGLQMDWQILNMKRKANYKNHTCVNIDSHINPKLKLWKESKKRLMLSTSRVNRKRVPVKFLRATWINYWGILYKLFSSAKQKVQAGGKSVWRVYLYGTLSQQGDSPFLMLSFYEARIKADAYSGNKYFDSSITQVEPICQFPWDLRNTICLILADISGFQLL